MDGVIAQQVARGDALFFRGVTNPWCVRWTRQTQANGPFVPVDLSGWECVFEMLSPAGEVWYARPCDAHGPDGVAAVYIPPGAFAEDVWQARRQGSWRMRASKDTVTEMLGCGYWLLTD